VARQVAIDGRQPGLDALLGDVVKADVVASDRANMRDAVAHLTGADDADFADLHVNKCLNSEDAGAYNGVPASARAFRRCNNARLEG
jgi:hypothetical protein